MAGTITNVAWGTVFQRKSYETHGKGGHFNKGGLSTSEFERDLL